MVKKDKTAYKKSLKNPTPLELETMSPLEITLYSLFMTRTSSRLLGYCMKQQIPRMIRKPLYSTVCKLYHINTNEFEGKFEDYPSPSLFFTRSLKSNVRKIVRHKDILVSPCDCTVSYMDCNPITTPNLQAHQVKGIRYLLTDFLGCTIPQTNPYNNIYTVTLYLSPSDYHRVHAPTYFSMDHRIHFPGKLLPVKNFYAQNIKGLFTINERVVLNGTWPQGFFSLGMVGAYNVGSISLANSQDQELKTNRRHEKHRGIGKNYCYRKEYQSPEKVIPGDLVGTFHLGSTVVLAFESSEFTWLVKPGEKVKMGQPLGYIHRSAEVDKLCYHNSMDVNDDECIELVESSSDESSEGYKSPYSDTESDEMSMETIEIESTAKYEIHISNDSLH